MELNQKYPPEDVSPKYSLYRCLYLSGEQHGDRNKRVTDLNWSKNTFRLNWIMQEPGNWAMKDDPERAFVNVELMLVPEDTQLPLDSKISKTKGSLLEDMFSWFKQVDFGDLESSKDKERGVVPNVGRNLVAKKTLTLGSKELEVIESVIFLIHTKIST